MQTTFKNPLFSEVVVQKMYHRHHFTGDSSLQVFTLSLNTGRRERKGPKMNMLSQKPGRLARFAEVKVSLQVLSTVQSLDRKPHFPGVFALNGPIAGPERALLRGIEGAEESNALGKFRSLRSLQPSHRLLRPAAQNSHSTGPSRFASHG